MIPLQGRYPIDQDTVEPQPGRIPSPPQKRLLIRGHHLVHASTLVGAIFVLAWLAVGFGGPAVTSLGSAIVDRNRPSGSQATAGVGAATTQGGRGGVAGGSS
ncbi:MAG: hypothetical protein M3O87_02125, partial [Candidatus Dormibacteraeota bacterium]|nr:hypothetical protein [Candidatus Dormibacteraeota bacterium]